MHLLNYSMQRIVDWLASNFKRDEGIDLLKDKQALQRLTETAEKAKMELSSLTQTNIRFVSLRGNCALKPHSFLGSCSHDVLFSGLMVLIHAACPSSLPLLMAPNTLRPLLLGLSLRSCVQTSLTGSQLYNLCLFSSPMLCSCRSSLELRFFYFINLSNLICRLRTPVENALRDAKLSFKDLDEVILVGGSTRIPAVQGLVKKMTSKEPNVTVNPDEVVALGAAVQVGLCQFLLILRILSLSSRFS